MQKYGISTNVVQSYLEDFHGRSVALIGVQGKDIPVREAVCTDCHGTHDIQKVDRPQFAVIKANLLETCQKCHPDATLISPGHGYLTMCQALQRHPWCIWLTGFTGYSSRSF